VYVRDSGIVHALLGLRDLDALLGHPVAGSSWEGFVIEQLIAAAPQAQASFYRTSHGAEVDLVLEFNSGATWVIENKIGVGKDTVLPSLRTVRAVFPHTALQSVVSTSGLAR
jgi:predicted AAA+ superfamily ATPase